MSGVALVLAVTFIALRSFGAIDWSWGYVLLPLAWFLGALFEAIHQANKDAGRSGG